MTGERSVETSQQQGGPAGAFEREPTVLNPVTTSKP